MPFRDPTRSRILEDKEKVNSPVTLLSPPYSQSRFRSLKKYILKPSPRNTLKHLIPQPATRN
jgi:hypothetical protein